MILKRKAVDNNAKDLAVVANLPSSAENQQAKYNEENLKAVYQWCDANTFTCNICQFTSNSLKVFKKHVKGEHKTSLSKFSASYSSTDILYRCHCCDEQVYHEMSAIKTHVENHLLSLEQYTGFYEKKRSRVITPAPDTQGGEKMVSVTVQELDVSHNERWSISEQDPLDITSTLEEEIGGIESSHHDPEELLIPGRPDPLLYSSQEKCTNVDPASAVIVAGIISTIIQSIIAADMESHENDNNQNIVCSASSTSNNSTLSDVFLYMCPFTDCDFHLDTRGLESGQAERHVGSVHLAEGGDHPWRKISLETRMEELFSDD